MMADWWAAHGDIAMIKRAWRRVIDHIGQGRRRNDYGLPLP